MVAGHADYSQKEKQLANNGMLNTSERLALGIVLKEEEEINKRLSELKVTKMQIISDVETRFGLEPGSFDSGKYGINMNGDLWTVREFPEDG